MRDGVWCEALGCVTPRPFAPCRTPCRSFVDAVGPQKNIVPLSLSLSLSLAM
jgi:hypothetical protein